MAGVTEGRADPGGEAGSVGSATSPDDRCRAVRRYALVPSWVALGVGAAVAVAAPGLPRPVRYLPLLASVLVVGLPHGAADHRAVARLSGWSRRRAYAAVGALYLALGAPAVAVLFAAPALAVVALLALTAAHWGHGDRWPLAAAVGATHRRRALAAAVRGGLPVVVPLAVHPVRSERVLDAVVGRFDPAAPARLDPLFAPRTRVALLGGVAALAGLSLALGRVGVESGGPGPDARRAWRVDAAETALLAGFFVAVPPVLAVGLYFVCWHSLRHVVRLALADPVAGAALAGGRPEVAARRFARDAGPLSAAALVLLGALAVAVPVAPASVPGVAGVYLALLAALTPAHAVVVAWMEWVGA